MARSIFYYTDSRELGGAELALLMLLAKLDRAAWAPTLLLDEVPGAEPLAERAARLGVPVRLLPPMPLGLAGARRAVGLARLLRRERPAVFHAHLSWPLAAKWGLAAAVAARLPTVATVHLVPRFQLERSSYWQLRALAVGVDRYLAVSHDIAAELAARFRWPAAKIEVVHNAVDVERFEKPPRPTLRAELSGGHEHPVVLTPARLDEQKGHTTLIRAAADVPDAVFALAGEGPLRGDLEAEVARLGVADRVAFLGQRADVPELLAACDVFALPSLYEGTSLAVLEAMAARRPVVSSRIGGTEELIIDGVSGILVPPGDASALAGALRHLLGDEGLRASLAARARERVEREFAPAATTARIEGIYEELSADGQCRS